MMVDSSDLICERGVQTLTSGWQDRTIQVGVNKFSMFRRTTASQDATIAVDSDNSGNVLMVSTNVVPNTLISRPKIQNLEQTSRFILYCVDFLMFGRTKHNYYPKSLSDCIVSYIGQASELWIQKRVIFIHSCLLDLCMNSNSNNNKLIMKYDYLTANAIADISYEIVRYTGGYGFNQHLARVIQPDVVTDCNDIADELYNCYSVMTSHCGRVGYYANFGSRNGIRQQIIDQRYISDDAIIGTDLMNESIYYAELTIYNKTSDMYIGIATQSGKMNQFLSNQIFDDNTSVTDVVTLKNLWIDYMDCKDDNYQIYDRNESQLIQFKEKLGSDVVCCAQDTNNIANSLSYYSPHEEKIDLSINSRLTQKKQMENSEETSTVTFVQTRIETLRKAVNSAAMLDTMNKNVDVGKQVLMRILQTVEQLKTWVLAESKIKQMEVKLRLNTNKADNNDDCVQNKPQNNGIIGIDEKDVSQNDESGVNNSIDIDKLYQDACDEVDQFIDEVEHKLSLMKLGYAEKMVGNDGRAGRWHESDLEYNLHLQQRLKLKSIEMKNDTCILVKKDDDEDSDPDASVSDENESKINIPQASIQGDCKLLEKLKQKNKLKYGKEGLQYYQTGDVIGVWVDLKHKLIKFYKNRKLQCACYDLPQLNEDEGEKYYLFVTLGWQSASANDCVVFDRICLSNVELID